MRRNLLHCHLVALLALGAVSGCQSAWKLPGFGSGGTSAPPPKASKSALFTDEEMAAKPITKSQRADLQMELARSCERKDELDKAQHLYEEVIRKAPKRADAHHRLAVVHDKLGQYAKSEPRYRQALTLAPKNAEIHVDLGYSYYLQHRWAESEKSLKMAVKLSPDMKRAHNNLGLVLARAERYDEARTQFFLAGCNEPEARANLMHAMMIEQRWPQARQECQAALASRNVSPAMKQRLGKLDEMLASRCNNLPATAAAGHKALPIPAPGQPLPGQAANQAVAAVPEQPCTYPLPEVQAEPEQQYTLVSDVRPAAAAVESPIQQPASPGLESPPPQQPAPQLESANSISLAPARDDHKHSHGGGSQTPPPSAPTGEMSFGALRVVDESPGSSPQ